MGVPGGPRWSQAKQAESELDQCDLPVKPVRQSSQWCALYCQDGHQTMEASLMWLVLRPRFLSSRRCSL